MSSPITLKIVLVGIGSVGKSSLVLRFVYDEFTDKYDPTKADSYKKIYQIDEKSYSLEILDTAGEESFSAIRDNYYKHAQGFLIVYDVTNIKSLKETEQIYSHIQRVRNSNKFPAVLVGNKSDLATKVSEEDVNLLIKELNIPHLTTSAKETINVVPAFEQVAKLIIPTIVVSSKPVNTKGCCIIL